MKQKIKKYLKEIVLFIIIMTIFANVLSIYRSMDLNKSPLNMVSVTLLNSTKYTLPTDRPILVHFWATWCPVCKAEAGNIQTMSDNFEVITIAVKSGSNEDIKEYIKSRDLNFKFKNDEDGYLAHKFGVNIYPTTIIYDKNRDVVFSDVGYTSTWGLWLRMLWAKI